MIVIDLRQKIGHTDRQTKTEYRQRIVDLSAQQHIDLVHVDGGIFSVFISLKLATELKKRQAEAVIVSRERELAAAVNTLSLGYNYKIVFAPDSNSDADIPHSLPKSVADKIDFYIFSSEEAQLAWNKILSIPENRQTVLYPAVDETEETYAEATLTDGILHIGWVGEIAHPELLGTAVDIISRQPDGVSMHIFGTGKAGRVMPIVRRTRDNRKLQITWHGNDAGDISPEQMHAYLQTQWKLTDRQMQAMSQGRPLLHCTDAKTFATEYEQLRSDYEQASGQAKKLFASRHRLSFHVEQFAKILLSLRQ